VSGIEIIKGARILIVDDDLAIVKVMQNYLIRSGFYTFAAFDGEEALKKVEEVSPDLIVLDVMMPKLDGYEVCKILKENDKTRFIPIIMVTAFGEKRNKIKGIEIGADDFLTKPLDVDELLAKVRSLLRLKYLIEQLDNAENILFSLVNIIDAKDSYTGGHSERVTRFALMLAEKIGLPNEQLGLLEKAAKIHDIGKIGVPEAILNKLGPLTEEEFAQIKKHPEIGEKICSPLNSLQPLLKIIRHHHERYDGNGYPDGIRGTNIPVEARIIAIVDSYDAMATDRPYRNKLLNNKIINIFRAGAGTQWDKDLVEKFIEIINSGGLNAKGKEI